MSTDKTQYSTEIELKLLSDQFEREITAKTIEQTKKHEEIATLELQELTKLADDKEKTISSIHQATEKKIEQLNNDTNTQKKQTRAPHIQHKTAQLKDKLIDLLSCPITFEPFDDPHIAIGNKHGHTFTHKAILESLNKKGENPINREALTKEELKPNKLVQQLTIEIHSNNVFNLAAFKKVLTCWHEGLCVPLDESVAVDAEGNTFKSKSAVNRYGKKPATPNLIAKDIIRAINTHEQELIDDEKNYRNIDKEIDEKHQAILHTLRYSEREEIAKCVESYRLLEDKIKAIHNEKRKKLNEEYNIDAVPNFADYCATKVAYINKKTKLKEKIQILAEKHEIPHARVSTILECIDADKLGQALRNVCNTQNTLEIAEALLDFCEPKNRKNIINEQPGNDKFNAFHYAATKQKSRDLYNLLVKYGHDEELKAIHNGEKKTAKEMLQERFNNAPKPPKEHVDTQKPSILLTPLPTDWRNLAETIQEKKLTYLNLPHGKIPEIFKHAQPNVLAAYCYGEAVRLDKNDPVLWENYAKFLATYIPPGYQPRLLEFQNNLFTLFEKITAWTFEDFIELCNNKSKQLRQRHQNYNSSSSSSTSISTSTSSDKLLLELKQNNASHTSQPYSGTPNVNFHQESPHDIMLKKIKSVTIRDPNLTLFFELLTQKKYVEALCELCKYENCYSYNCAKILLSYKDKIALNINTIDSKGFQPIHYAVMFQGSPCLFLLFSDHGADQHTVKVEGKSANEMLLNKFGHTSNPSCPQ